MGSRKHPMWPRMDSRPRRLLPKHRTRLWEEASHASLPLPACLQGCNRPRPLSTALQQACHAVRDAAIMHKRPWRAFPRRRRPRLPLASSVLPFRVSRARPYPLLLEKTHGGTRSGPPPGQTKACLKPSAFLAAYSFMQARRAGAESLWAAYSPPLSEAPHLLAPFASCADGFAVPP